MIKTELVDEEKWITNQRFTRVYGVYQVSSSYHNILYTLLILCVYYTIIDLTRT